MPTKWSEHWRETGRESESHGRPSPTVQRLGTLGITGSGKEETDQGTHNCEGTSSPSPAAPRVDVVVVAYDGVEFIRNLIPELLASEGVEVRVIVIDNASVDRSSDVAAALGAEVVHLPRNIGFGGACNVGLANASAPWVVFANQDVRVPKDALAGLIASAEGWASTEGKRVVVGPKMVGPDGRVVETFHRFPSWWSQSIAMVFGEARAGDRDRDPCHPTEAEWMSAAFILGQRTTFEEVAGFDTDYFMYVEDVDLFRRLRDVGVVCRWAPAVTVVHAVGFRSASPERHAQAVMNWRRYFASHRGRWAGEVVFAAGVLGGVFHAIYWGVAACLGRVGARPLAAMFGRGTLIAARDVWWRRRRTWRDPFGPGGTSDGTDPLVQ